MLAAAKMTAVVMFLVAACGISSWLITQANIPGELGSLLEPLIANKTLLMIAMMVLVLVVGTALDFTPTVLILTPVLMPLVKQAGIDPVYFGVLFIINNAIGLHHAAGGHRAQRGQRRRPGVDDRRDARRQSVPVRADRSCCSC